MIKLHKPYHRARYSDHSNNVSVPEEYVILECVSNDNTTPKLATFNQRICAGQKFCVLAEAFDIVNHEISLEMLQFYDTEKQLQSCLRPFLHTEKNCRLNDAFPLMISSRNGEWSSNDFPEYQFWGPCSS